MPVHLLHLNSNVVTALNLVPKYILSSSHVSPPHPPPPPFFKKGPCVRTTQEMRLFHIIDNKLVHCLSCAEIGTVIN